MVGPVRPFFVNSVAVDTALEHGGSVNEGRPNFRYLCGMLVCPSAGYRWQVVAASTICVETEWVFTMDRNTQPGGKTMYAGARLHRMLSDLTGVLASAHRNPVVLAGDFNVTSQGARSSNNEGVAVFARLRAWGMANCIAHKRAGQAGVADCECPDGAACSHVQTFRTGTQLDYAFVSDSIVPALLDCRTESTAEAWRRSDLCPIVIDLNERAI